MNTTCNNCKWATLGGYCEENDAPVPRFREGCEGFRPKRRW